VTGVQTCALPISWRSATITFLKCLKVWDVVSSNNIPDPNTSPNEVEVWEEKSLKALAYFYSNIDITLWPIIQGCSNAPEAWAALYNKFDRKNATTLHTLLKAIVTLQYSEKTPISDHIATFDSLWHRLQERTTASASSKSSPEKKDSIAAVFANLSLSSEAKASFLMLTFPKSFDNVIDNLQTKENITYDEVCDKLTDLDTRKDDRNPSGNTVNKAYLSFDSDKSKKECTWCKARKMKFLGHTFHECWKLKKYKENQKAKKNTNSTTSTANPASDEAHHTAYTVKMATKSDPTDMITDTASRHNHIPEIGKHRWIFDTGATKHMTPYQDLFSTFQPYNGKVKIGDDSLLDATGIGNVDVVVLLPNGKQHNVTINNVLFVPKLGNINLLSWARIEDQNIVMVSKKHEILLHAGDINGPCVGWAKRSNGEYILQTTQPTKPSQTLISIEAARAASSAPMPTSFELWHRRLGHLGRDNMKLLFKLTKDAPNIEKEDNFCEPCILGKNTRTISRQTAERSSQPLQLVHSDLSGKFTTPSIGGSNYYITFVDDYSRFTSIYFLKNKSDALGAFIKYKAFAEKHTGYSIKAVRSDNGGEYQAFNKYLEEYCHNPNPFYFLVIFTIFVTNLILY